MRTTKTTAAVLAFPALSSPMEEVLAFLRAHAMRFKSAEEALKFEGSDRKVGNGKFFGTPESRAFPMPYFTADGKTADEGEGEYDDDDEKPVKAPAHKTAWLLREYLNYSIADYSARADIQAVLPANLIERQKRLIFVKIALKYYYATQGVADPVEMVYYMSEQCIAVAKQWAETQDKSTLKSLYKNAKKDADAKSNRGKYATAAAIRALMKFLCTAYTSVNFQRNFKAMKVKDANGNTEYAVKSMERVMAHVENMEAEGFQPDEVPDWIARRMAVITAFIDKGADAEEKAYRKLVADYTLHTGRFKAEQIGQAFGKSTPAVVELRNALILKLNDAVK